MLWILCDPLIKFKPIETNSMPFINRFTLFLLRSICKKLVKQGPLHRGRIIAYYRVMREAAELEFTEDNKLTLDAFLKECHAATFEE